MSAEAIAAEGAALVQAAAASPVPGGWLAGAWSRLTATSPRQMHELSADSFALVINGFVDPRSKGAASQAKLGEGVMDCVYALLSGAGGVSGSSPLGRLFSAVVGFFVRLRGSPPSEEPGVNRVHQA